MENAVKAGIDKRAKNDVEKDEEVKDAKDIYRPHPSLALVKSWQGIVELCIRISVVVLSFLLLVSASVSVSDVNIDTAGASSGVVGMVKDGTSASGFMVFVGLLILLSEIALIVIRFLNFGAINRFFRIFVILEVIVVVVLGVFSFSGGVAAAVSGEDWEEQIETWERQGGVIFSRGHRIPRNLGATAAFGILTTLALVVLGTWMVLYLVFDWNKHNVMSTQVGGVKSQEKENKIVFKE